MRARLGKSRFTNEEMESSIEHMLALRCEQLDLFYMTGLPGQTCNNVLETVDAIETLFRRFDARLGAFITPMAPFLDPGSEAFEHPERHGYRLLARTLEEHRALLEQRHWSLMLNYETEWMTRHEIARATYGASMRLDALKRKYGHNTELFPPASFLRNFRIGGILSLLGRELAARARVLLPARGEKVAEGRGAPHPRFADPLPAPRGEGHSIECDTEGRMRDT